MTQYRKKPLLVDAVPVNDILESNPVPEWVAEAMKPVDETDEGYGAVARVTVIADGIDIVTKQGQYVRAGSGEWLLRAAADDLWPIDGDVFEASYERPDLPVNGDLEDLLATTDGMTWAAKFVEQFKGLVVDGTVIDEGLMVTWFANAIETGRRAGEEGKVTGEKLRERVDEAMVAFQPSDRITDLGAKAYHDELVSSIASAIEQPEQP